MLKLLVFGLLVSAAVVVLATPANALCVDTPFFVFDDGDRSTPSVELDPQSVTGDDLYCQGGVFDINSLP